MHPDIYPYQAEGARFLADRPFALLADDMGVGKTIQAIAACDLIGARTVLVVCPAIARVNWVREFDRWQTVPRTARAILTTKDKVDTDVMTASFNAVTSPQMRSRLEKRHWDVLIVDEAHALKTPAALRTKAVYGGRCERLTGLARRASRVWLLTGTPAPNNPSELWTHLRAGHATKLKYSEFVGRYCNAFDDGFKMRITGAKKSALPELVNVLRPITLRRRLEDVQKDLPPIRYAHVTVSPERLPPMPDLSPEAKEVLRSVEAVLRNGRSHDDLHAVLAAGTMHLATLRRWTGVAKAWAVADLIKEEMAGNARKFVVFAVHTEVLRKMQLRFGDDRQVVLVDGGTSPLKRQQAIDAFQTRPNPRVFLCQLAVGATALTLTAAHDVVFAEISWTPADLVQAAKRCHRIGQTKPVLARSISLAGSIDEKVTAVVMRKVADLTALNAALQPTHGAGPHGNVNSS